MTLKQNQEHRSLEYKKHKYQNIFFQIRRVEKGWVSDDSIFVENVYTNSEYFIRSWARVPLNGTFYWKHDVDDIG